MVTVSRRKLGWLGVSVVLVLAVGLLAAAVVFALMLLGFRHYTATAYVLFRDRTVELLDLSSAAHRDLFQTIKADQLQRMNSRYILRRALEQTGGGQPLVGSAQPGKLATPRLGSAGVSLSPLRITRILRR